MLHYSISMLLLLMVVIGVGCTALMNPNHIWDQAMFTAVLLLILVCSIKAIVEVPPRRLFYIGFVLFAGVYLLATTAGSYWPVPPRNRLLTHSAVRYMQGVMHPDLPPVQTYPVMLMSPAPAGAEAAFSFHNLGHTLWALILGLLGGVVASTMCRRAANRRKRSDAESAGT